MIPALIPCGMILIILAVLVATWALGQERRSWKATIKVLSDAHEAAELARADMAKFRFLGYLTEKQDSTLFLAKDEELFMVKKGDKIMKTCRASRRAARPSMKRSMKPRSLRP